MECGGSSIDGNMNRRQNNYRKFRPFFTQRIIESPNLGFPPNMKERGTIESNEEFANYPNEFFHIFTGIAKLWKKPVADKNRALDNEVCFQCRMCSGDHVGQHCSSFLS